MEKFVKYVAVTLSVLVLSACSMQGLAEKILPANIQADATRMVDAVLQKDVSAFVSMQNEMSDEDFAAALNNMFSYISEGAEIRRDIVGANSNVSASLGERTSRSYNVIYEIQTEQGFTAISLDYVQTAEQEECCVLQFVNVQNSKTSPYRIPLAKAAKIAKFVGIFVLLAIVLLVIFLVRRSRRRRAR